MQLSTLTLLSSLLALASAQFQFFEQMFNQGGQQQHHHHHQQEKQNVASDSEWYQRNYEAGTSPLPLPYLPLPLPLYPCPSHPPPC